MDPLNALVLSAPPEWLPFLILAALLLKGWTAWLDKKKTAAMLDASPAPEEIHKEPDVKG